MRLPRVPSHLAVRNPEITTTHTVFEAGCIKLETMSPSVPALDATAAAPPNSFTCGSHTITLGPSAKFSCTPLMKRREVSLAIHAIIDTDLEQFKGSGACGGSKWPGETMRWIGTLQDLMEGLDKPALEPPRRYNGRDYEKR